MIRNEGGTQIPVEDLPGVSQSPRGLQVFEASSVSSADALPVPPSLPQKQTGAP